MLGVGLWVHAGGGWTEKEKVRRQHVSDRLYKSEQQSCHSGNASTIRVRAPTPGIFINYVLGRFLLDIQQPHYYKLSIDWTLI